MEQGIFYILLFIVTTAYSKEYDYIWTKSATNYTFDEIQLVGHVLGEFEQTHLLTQCAYHCLDDNRCLSFNYDLSQKLCQLSGSDDQVHPDSLTSGVNFQYYRRETFQINKDALSLCSDNPCAHDGECLDVVTAEGINKYLCVCQGPWTGMNCTLQEGSVDWNNWSDWSECSTTCDQGWRLRQRACVDVSTQQELSVFDCLGKELDVQACNLDTCPYWSQWSDWSECSSATTCGRGLKSRKRQCLHNGSPGVDRLCMGVANETAPCESPGCHEAVRLVYGATYGEGVVEVYNDHTMSWQRVCNSDWGMNDADVICKQLGFPTGASAADSADLDSVQMGEYALSMMGCVGQEKTIQGCVHQAWDSNVTCTQSYATVQCIVDGSWNNWSEWGVCSVTCETGQETRNRSCDFPRPRRGGLDCEGDSIERRGCEMIPCPVDGQWKPWGEWSQCSLECGGGMRDRARECQDALHAGDPCLGDTTQDEACNTHPCPVEGYWKPWLEWTTCNKTCGGGSQSRTRQCVEPQHGGAGCIGVANEDQACNTDACPVDCTWNMWAEWEPCNVTCGLGGQNRHRTKNVPQHSGADCIGAESEWQSCHPVECPIDCVWNEWQDWGACSLSCGTGNQQRMRTKMVVEQFGGLDCSGSPQAEQTCNPDPCPVDGSWLPWSDWQTCTTTCGDGERTRTRTCNVGLHGGSNCTGPSSETEACFEMECPVDGIWEEWSDWSECSVTCANGTQTRSRTCTGPFHNGLDCQGEAQQIQDCFPRHCSVDGAFEEWSQWSACSETCGDGTRSRTRSCTGVAHGGQDCVGARDESQDCFVVECPVDGVWSEWTLWSDCSATCGPGGSRSRSRNCDGPYHGGDDCSGDSDVTEDCFVTICPVDGYWEAWSDWSECSVTCGPGVLTRTRTCVEPIAEGAPCLGPATENKNCTIECAKPGEWLRWGPWGTCSVTCGPGGLRMRTRTCNMTTHGENTAMCLGDADEKVTCHDYDCLPLAANCEAWRTRGLEDSTVAEVKPQDNAFTAFCNLTAIDNMAVTELEHDSMNEILVHGYESAGQFVHDITYNTSMDNVLALIATSTNCRQFISWGCISATITNPHDSDIINSFWQNRDGDSRYYWGGVPETGVGCACGLDDSCDSRGKRCNCDANDMTLRRDEGYLGYKDDLPVTVLRAGDTGGDDELGYASLGPLQCY